jgi:hypothetical protein
MPSKSRARAATRCSPMPIRPMRRCRRRSSTASRAAARSTPTTRIRRSAPPATTMPDRRTGIRWYVRTRQRDARRSMSTA